MPGARRARVSARQGGRAGDPKARILARLLPRPSAALLSYDDLFQCSPNAYMVLDREFRYLEANRAY